MKPITYKDNVSELVSISVKEAMQMLMDNQDRIGVSMGNLPDRKGAVSREQMADDVAASMKVSKPDPVKVLDCEGGQFDLVGVIVKPWVYFIVDDGVCVHYIKSIHRRENYIIGYNGEKLPPLPEGYGLVPESKGEYFSGIHCHPEHCGWSHDSNWILPEMDGMAFACKTDSREWRALFQPKPSIQLELGKWYECRDGSVVQVKDIWLRDDGKLMVVCSDIFTRYIDGTCPPASLSSRDAIRAIDPELSVSLSNLDHETANKVWRARS